MNDYLTPTEVQKILKISRNSAYSLINQPGFPKIKIGHSIRIPKAEFEKYMSHHVNKVFKL